ncbi:MAG TPA: hypothetical protein DEP45_00385 [Armatimonadetes bacterium]|nr:hypothetical protein [Armatimonadota bacterium]
MTIGRLTMRWSLMTYTVNAGQPGGLRTLEEMADFAHEVGFEALELSSRDLVGREPEEIRAICDARGLAISCINGPASLAAEDDAEFEAGLAQARDLADAAVAVGSPVIMIIPGHATSEEDLPRAADRIVEGLSQAVAYARERGVTVSIEDFPNRLAPYASIEQVRYLLDNVPGLQLTFDNGNWVVGGDDPAKAAQEFAGRIANAHLKDWEIDPNRGRIELPDGTWIRGGLHGQGLLDHRAILSALVGGGYDGTLAFEYEGPLDHCESTRQGLAYLRQALDGVRG